LKSSDVHELIDKMGRLPSLPQTLLEIQKVAGDTNSSASDLARCILRDQALTMRVLKVVNSVMYRRSDQDEVLTVQKAVVVLGFRTVKQLALGLSVFEMMSKLSRSPQLLGLARHSLVTAGFAQNLAEASGTICPDQAFVTGLIHDIGKVVLIECDPGTMDLVNQELAQGSHPHDAERRHFGISHDRAGRRLAARWGLPTELQDVIGEHHDHDPLDPPRNLSPLLGTIVFANAMATFTCRQENLAREHNILRKAGRVLGIPARHLDGIHEQVAAEAGGLGRALGLDLPELADFGRLVNEEGSVTVAPRGMAPQDVARRTARQLELYQQVGQGLAAGQSPAHLVGLILEGAVQILGFDRVIYLTADRQAKMLRPIHWAGCESEVLARALNLPLNRQSGAVAMALLEHRALHVPQAWSRAYGTMVGEQLLEAARCTGFAVSPVATPDGVLGVLYGDCGAEGPDVVAEQAKELHGLALQLGLVLSTVEQKQLI
jgi:putative nucleotidyltransferase with HDIG domain